jgi:hypothetical protein
MQGFHEKYLKKKRFEDIRSRTNGRRKDHTKEKGLKISEAVQMDEGKIIQKKKVKKTNNHLQYITQKTKD